MSALSVRAGLLIAAAVASFALIAGSVFAAPGDNGNGTLPGWGTGDENHEHTGPPGGTSVRPGNGNGDENHEHTGPPGLSVRP